MPARDRAPSPRPTAPLWLAARCLRQFLVVAGRVLVCVYTMRGTEADPVRWIISLRKANKGESHAYRTAFAR
jgi:hypothetical protein